MSFANPVVLLALLAIPLLVHWYTGRQRRRAQAASAFVTPQLTESVAPRRPRWRRHAPMLAFLIALAVLIIGAARPERSVAKPTTDGAVMLVDDISNSMQATDVAPSRLRAAQRAAERFLSEVPSAVRVGLVEFAYTPTLLQSPTSDHGLTKAALSRTPRTSGGTAVGEALLTAASQLRSIPKIDGKRPPGAIVLISDGVSNVGITPLTVAHQAAAWHIPIYTVSVGTPNGTIQMQRGAQTVTAPVPVDRGQLAEIAHLSGGRGFTAADAAGVRAAYDHLAARLGNKQVKEEITSSFAGLGLVLLLVGSALTLRWFGRLI